MIYIFNIVLTLFVLIIAYWWANQGVFSALLHLLAVVVAGAVAFGVWEPLVTGFLLRGGWFDNYAWGVTLLGVFAITLFLLRLVTDRLAPANVDLPHWANLTFGFPLGAAAGILTVGIIVIGCGFFQSKSELMGYRGYGRSGRDGSVVRFSNQPMWIPVSYWTAEFYSWLSVTSMWSPEPMRRVAPRLNWQASLVRDSYQEGKGQIVMVPSAAKVTGLLYNAGGDRAAVDMQFDGAALDFGEQLTIANSQIRLIGAARGWAAAPVVHPDMWAQDGTLYRFDNIAHYVTSVPGRESAAATILFKIPANFVPKYIQVKNNRYRLPAPQPFPPGLLSGAGLSTSTGGSETVELSARPIPESDLRISNSIRPIKISTNSLPGTMKEQENYLVEGTGTFGSSPGLISRALQIKGIYEPPGTRIVTLDVSRGKVTDLFGSSLRGQLAEDAVMAMVDSQGNTYSPLGYILKKGTDTDIVLAPGKYVRTLDQLPILPTAGTQELMLYFRVTEGATLVGFKVGDKTLGTCNLMVTGR